MGVVLPGALAAVERITELGQLLDARKHLLLLLNFPRLASIVPDRTYEYATNGEENGSFRKNESSGNQPFEVRLETVLAEAADLTGGQHLHSHDRVSSRQTREGELWDLNRHFSYWLPEGR